VNISSVIVRARPEKLALVRDALARTPGVDVHADTPDGRLIVTVEDCAGDSNADVFIRFHNLDGVIGASLVYQYCDDDIQEARLP
jgi:nitrate reductase NapD